MRSTYSPKTKASSLFGWAFLFYFVIADKMTKEQLKRMRTLYEKASPTVLRYDNQPPQTFRRRVKLFALYPTEWKAYTFKRFNVKPVDVYPALFL